MGDDPFALNGGFLGFLTTVGRHFEVSEKKNNQFLRKLWRNEKNSPKFGADKLIFKPNGTFFDNTIYTWINVVYYEEQDGARSL